MAVRAKGSGQQAFFETEKKRAILQSQWVRQTVAETGQQTSNIIYTLFGKQESKANPFFLSSSPATLVSSTSISFFPKSDSSMSCRNRNQGRPWDQFKNPAQPFQFQKKSWERSHPLDMTRTLHPLLPWESPPFLSVHEPSRQREGRASEGNCPYSNFWKLKGYGGYF